MRNIHISIPLKYPSPPVGGPSSVQMDRLGSDQLKKDWLVMLTSTSGVMLTVCLAALAVIYSSSADKLEAWKKALLSVLIFISAVLLATCMVKALSALGSLILALDLSLKNQMERIAELEKLTAQKAKKAQDLFIAAACSLMAAIAVIVIVFNWNFFASLLR